MDDINIILTISNADSYKSDENSAQYALDSQSDILDLKDVSK
jgi:hypothetical protein